ncbi:MAG: hypothetical protein N2255_08790, partial [Kiritimatiellae bacterium]|nr:hypothetical protein [Kiritimatiellia bacterium]
MRTQVIVLLMSLTTLLIVQSDAETTVDVPLTVWDVAGVERKQEICSTGVPLPCGLLKEPERLAVLDSAGKAVPAQFMILERWRDAGEGRGDLSIRWLLVTFLADVPAGGKSEYRLVRGQNPLPAAPVWVEEKGDSWSLGGLVFKKDFTSPFRLVLTTPDNKEISTEKQEIQWSVWERGPIRACLKAESPTDHSKFGFIAWIYAYAGKKRWDMTVVLKNTPNERLGPFYFRDFSVVWEPTELRDARAFVLGGEWGKPVSGSLQKNEAAYIYQDSDGTDQWDTYGKDFQMCIVLDWTPDKSKAKAGLPTFRGYKAFTDNRELGSGNFAAGWAVLNTPKGGGFAAIRDFYVQYPKATEVQPGRVILRLWPKYTRAFTGLHWLDDATRKWHDITFELSDHPLSAEDGEARSKAFDYPLVAHAPSAWYVSCQVVPPPTRVEKEFGGNVIRTQPGTGRNWVTFGGDVTDRIRRRYHGAELDPFAYTGDPTAAYRLAKTARHSAGMTPLWVEDYQYPRDAKKLTHAQYCGLVRDPGRYLTNTWHHGFMSWNDAHFCCQEIFDNWRLVGDPLALDAIGTIGRWCQAYVDFREGGGGLVAGTRADGLPLHNLCEAYRILGDESMRKSIDRFADICWKQVDKERGNYGVMDSWEGGKEKCEKPFMMAQVMQGLRGHYEITGSERTADQIYGMADFILNESSMGPWGFNYVVLI